MEYEILEEEIKSKDFTYNIKKTTSSPLKLVVFMHTTPIYAISCDLKLEIESDHIELVNELKDLLINDIKSGFVDRIAKKIYSEEN